MVIDVRKKFIYGALGILLVGWFILNGLVGIGPLTGSVQGGPAGAVVPSGLMGNAPTFNGAGGLRTGIVRVKSELQGTGIRDDASILITIAKLLEYILSFVGVVAVVAFVVSGFMFILGFGSENSIQRARKIMIWSSVGLLVIIFALPIVKFIISFAN